MRSFAQDSENHLSPPLFIFAIAFDDDELLEPYNITPYSRCN